MQLKILLHGVGEGDIMEWGGYHGVGGDIMEWEGYHGVWEGYHGVRGGIFSTF